MQRMGLGAGPGLRDGCERMNTAMWIEACIFECNTVLGGEREGCQTTGNNCLQGCEQTYNYDSQYCQEQFNQSTGMCEQQYAACQSSGGIACQDQYDKCIAEAQAVWGY